MGHRLTQRNTDFFFISFPNGTQINTEKHRFLFYFFICANLCASVSYFLICANLCASVSYFLWREDRRVKLIRVCCLSFLLGILRFNISAPLQSFDEGHVAYYNDQGWVKIEGVVSGEPDVRDTYTNLRVAVSRLEVDGQEHQVSGTVLVRAPRYPEHDYGDELQSE